MALAAVVASEFEQESDRSEKRPGAFRTISEVATDLAVPQHVLRFWEARFAQIKPLKRAGGRRFYRPDDIDLIKGIQQLLHGQGYTIKGAQRVLKENGVRFVQAVGRGEAEARAPTSAERDEDIAQAHGSELEDSDSDAVLLAVLHELQACREALAALRSDLIEPDPA